MSADNGIYILEYSDGYRVIHRSAIDNLYWHFSKGGMFNELNPCEVLASYGKEEEFKTLHGVLNKAREIYDDLDICEYGIQFITDFKGVNWYQITLMARGYAETELKAIEKESRQDIWQDEKRNLEMILQNRI
jgi:hypothetical protein